ncbi:MAG: hypothetical protein L6Q54_01185 [Leptospiraceae bacterium]|nr:hypothetical protein [Leptospiraceae bacterium]MCK6379853.1 hypothetical protein [Leptospiraceae bacterium]NUM42508.1 hypothetical protein [Leptospiraceae bacterium]
MNSEIEQIQPKIANQKKYKIQITVSIYRNGLLSYKNEMTVPSVYNRRSEARGHIKKEIRERLDSSNFFRSTRLDYDLVRYTEEATCNTFIRYCIREEC